MKYREAVFTHALKVYSTSPVLRHMWSVVVTKANALLTADRQIGPEASVRVLQSIMQYNFLSIQKTHRIGGMNAIPDHISKDSLRSGLRRKAVALRLAPSMHAVARDTGMSPSQIQHLLLGTQLTGSGVAAASTADAARCSAALSAASGSVNAPRSVGDYTVCLNLASHGIGFERSDFSSRRRSSSSAGVASGGDLASSGATQCVVGSLPVAGSSSSPYGTGVTVTGALGIAVGDVVMSVSSFPSTSAAKPATARLDLDPVSFLADGTAPYVYLHCSLTILNRGVVVLPYHFLMSLLRAVFGLRILIHFVSFRYMYDACMRTGGRVTTPSLS